MHLHELIKRPAYSLYISSMAKCTSGVISANLERKQELLHIKTFPQAQAQVIVIVRPIWTSAFLRNDKPVVVFLSSQPL